MAAEITVNTTPPAMTGTGITVEGQVAKSMPAPATLEQEIASARRASMDFAIAAGIQPGRTFCEIEIVESQLGACPVHKGDDCLIQLEAEE